MNNGKSNYLKINYAHKLNANPYDYQLVELILTLTKTRSKSSVLDLACGIGVFFDVFCSCNFRYHGLDIDYEDINKNITRCDISSSIFPFEDDTFELIFFKMGIEHLAINEIGHCLAEARRVLKLGGKIVILTPDWRWNYKNFFDEFTHQTPFTIPSLTSALQMSGFEVQQCKSFIQLPLIWKYSAIKFLVFFARFFYPIFGKRFKFIKFSHEREILAIAKKN